ncbi:uncharacterized protein LOC111885291 [Lactuca sativa]|uniref:uncharacterized protein LOC111885291 n=1 Tax=Lactuca sativa TaxID=4236 RepID=UPI000CD8DF8B|nr:uncharacterized protein LOC111885291 [Lactuca sativa]
MSSKKGSSSSNNSPPSPPPSRFDPVMFQLAISAAVTAALTYFCPDRFGVPRIQATTTPVAVPTAPTPTTGYAGNLPWCNRCSYHHRIPGPCREMICINCGKKGHLTRSCRAPVQLIGQAFGSSTFRACYGCGEIGHFKRNYPKTATTNNVNNAKMVLVVKQEETAADPTTAAVLI